MFPNVQFKGDVHHNELDFCAETFAMSILNSSYAFLLCKIFALSLNIEEHHKYFIKAV